MAKRQKKKTIPPPQSKQQLAVRMAGYSVAASAAMVAQTERADAQCFDPGPKVNFIIVLVPGQESITVNQPLYSLGAGLDFFNNDGVAELYFAYLGCNSPFDKPNPPSTSFGSLHYTQMVGGHPQGGVRLFTSNSFLKLFSNSQAALSANLNGMPSTAPVFTRVYETSFGTYSLKGNQPGSTGFIAVSLAGTAVADAWVEVTIGSLTINSFGIGSANSSANPVPEPGTLGMLAAGAAGLAAWRRRKNKQEADAVS